MAGKAAGKVADYLVDLPKERRSAVEAFTAQYEASRSSVSARSSLEPSRVR